MSGDVSAPYSRLAEVYDTLMSHVDYPKWAGYLQSITARYGNGGKRAADLACGTGKILTLLTEAGYRGVGIDISPAMLKIAGRRNRLSVAVGDLRRLGLRGPFDLITCSYDSVNHLTAEREVRAFLGALPRLLAPGGLVIFDVVTDIHIRRHFRGVVYREKTGDIDVVWRSRYSSTRRLCRSRIHVSIGHGRRRREFYEVHTERIYPLAAINRFVEELPVERIGPFDGFCFAPATEASERVHYVLRKPG